MWREGARCYTYNGTPTFPCEDVFSDRVRERLNRDAAPAYSTHCNYAITELLNIYNTCFICNSIKRQTQHHQSRPPSSPAPRPNNRRVTIQTVSWTLVKGTVLVTSGCGDSEPS